MRRVTLILWAVALIFSWADGEVRAGYQICVSKTIQFPEGARPMGALVSPDGKHLFVSAGRDGKG